MALYANLPLIVGPGIGGSVIVAATLALGEHVGWPIGMGIAFWSGLLFLVLTLLGLREVVTRMVPVQIKLALGASIGLFIAVLGFRNAGLVVANAKTNALMLGSFTAPGAIVALLGLASAVALHARKVPGSILFAIIGATLVGIPLGVTKLPAALISPAPRHRAGDLAARPHRRPQPRVPSLSLRLLRRRVLLDHGDDAGGRRQGGPPR